MVELLSPAGSYEAAYGAFNAGADAVYFGLSEYSARAFAKNFTKEEALDLIRYARLGNKKTYLTLNTLMKEEELPGAFSMLEGLCAEGLGGVIVQDLGLLDMITRKLKGIGVIASTQMAVTGVSGARLLKSMGVTRVVPARELTLSELSAIRHEADIEVEAFVHGAMCYSYSGMCLFSAMVGGRSGNRGRCAQACRMQYGPSTGSPSGAHDVRGTSALRGLQNSPVDCFESGDDAGTGEYILSMKDMCTVEYVPAMIRAGMDSFKIEGRMKHPAYSAGVTAVYRKYIDRYYGSPEKYGDRMDIDEEDMELLRSLYLRTDISDGYLFRRNGREMITVSSPAYRKTDEELIQKISGRYLSGKKRIRLDIECTLISGKRAELMLRAGEDAGIKVYGEVVQEALKAPLGEERVKEILCQLKDTDFEAGEITIRMDGNVFMPVGQLKALKNSGIEAVANELLSGKAGRARM